MKVPAFLVLEEC
jgi:hypothetical protein